MSSALYFILYPRHFWPSIYLYYIRQTTTMWVKILSVFCHWQVVSTLETGLYSIKYILYACRSISQTILCLIIIMYKVLHMLVWKSCTVLIFVPCVHYAIHNRWPILPKLFRPVSRLYTLKKKHHIYKRRSVSKFLAPKIRYGFWSDFSSPQHQVLMIVIQYVGR